MPFFTFFTFTFHFLNPSFIYIKIFICNAKFLTFLDGGGICKDLFHMYCKIHGFFLHWRNILESTFSYCKILDFFRWWRDLVGSTLFVLQNSIVQKFRSHIGNSSIKKFITHIRNSRIFRIYFICTAKFYY